MHDHYHNLDFTLNLANGQNLVKAITDVSVDAHDGVADMTADIVNNKQGIDVHIERACRQTDIDIAIDVDLNTEQFTQEPETVFNATTVTDGHDDGTNGGLHTGIFDETVVHGLQINLPEAQVNRNASTITFGADTEGNKPQDIKAFPGQLVTLPMGTEYSQDGAIFGGWNDAEGYHYYPGNAITMPKDGLSLIPAFGKIEISIEATYKEGKPIVKGNQMAQFNFANDNPFDFTGVTLDNGKRVTEESVKTITFIDKDVTYDEIEDRDKLRVKVTNVSDAVYARHLGATRDDKVVAYLVSQAQNPDNYDLFIAGPGGVKAPADCSYMFGDSKIEKWNWYFEKIDLQALDTSGVTDMTWMFSHCGSLTSLNLNGLDTSQVVSMFGTFDYCKSLTNLDVSKLDTAKVENMTSIFSDCRNLTDLNISEWNISSLKNMNGMFNNCSGLKNLDIGNWDTSSVTNMNSVFSGCSGLIELNLSGWNTSSVESMSDIFSRCSGLTELNLSGWDTSKVTSMAGMFSSSPNLTKLNISHFDTSKVTSMMAMFAGCSGLTELDLSNFDTSKVSCMSRMFYYCSGLTKLDISHFNTSQLDQIDWMFSDCSSLIELNLGNFDTSRVENMTNVFAGCSNLTKLDVGDWDTSQVTNMYGIFTNCSSLKELDLSRWVTSSATDMREMFNGCSSLIKLDVNGFNTNNVTSMDNTFKNCSGLTKLDLSSWNTGSVTDMNCMFKGCSSLTELVGVNGWNTGSVADMSYMFEGCSGLTKLDLGAWNTGSVTNMSYMFEGCSGLTKLDLSAWNTGSVTNMSCMFEGCNLTELNLGGWDAGSVTNMSDMFKDCNLTNMDLSGWRFDYGADVGEMFSDCSVLSVDVSGWDITCLEDLSKMFSNCSGLTELDLSSWDTSSVTNMSEMFSNCSDLTTLILGDHFNLENVKDGTNMFNGCSKLSSIEGTLNFGAENAISDLEKMFYNCSALTSVTFTLPEGGANFPDLTSMRWMFTGCNSLESVTLGDNWNAPKLSKMSSMFSGCASLTDVTFEKWIVPDLTNTGSMFNGCTSLNNITLDWKTIAAPSQDDFTATGMFAGVPEGATLNIEGIGDNTAIQSLIQSEFDNRSANADAPVNDPAEEPPVEEPGDDTTTDEPTDGDQNGEQPSTGDETEPPVDEPQPPAEPEQPAEPQEPSEPEQPAEPETSTPLGADGAMRSLLPEQEVKPGDEIDFKVTVRYVGDPGVKTGRANWEFPLPDHLEKFIGDEEAGVSEGWNLEYDEEPLADENAGGFRGGKVDKPTIEKEGDRYVLRGSVEGLYTGNYVTASIKTTVQEPDAEDYNEAGYAFWDATAYGRDANGSDVSDTLRFWHSKEESPEPPQQNTVTINYAYTGDVPADVDVPETQIANSGDTVTVAKEPKAEGYEFEGWTRSDNKQTVKPGSELTLPTSDQATTLTLTGYWTQKESAKEYIDVTYSNTKGALDEKAQRIEVGDLHYLPKDLPDADHHVFTEWVPTLTVGGDTVELHVNDQGSKNETYTGTDKEGTTYTITTGEGVLSTDQFAGKDNVTVEFVGQWRPYTGTIHFDANGGEGTMADMTDVKWGEDQDLSKNGFTYPDDNYEFAGWALSTEPDADIVTTTAGLMTKDGAEVTLYAIWVPTNKEYGVGLDLTHVTSTNDAKTVKRGAAYETTLKVDDGYEMQSVEITMAGNPITSQCYDEKTGKVNIPSANGDIIIHATAKAIGGTEETCSVTYNLSHVDSSNMAADVQKGAAYETTLTADDGYKLQNVTITMAGQDITDASYAKDSGKVSISDVSGDIVITATAEAIDDGGNGGDNGGGGGITPPDKPEKPDEPDNGIADPDDTGVSDLLNTDDHIAYMHGYEDDTFGPSRTITRGEVASAFYRLLRDQDVEETKEFPDVPKDSWYHDTIAALAGKGLISGYEDGTFQPDKAITRAEFAAMATRFAKASTDKDVDFTDIAKDSWYYGAVQTAVSYGWLRGYEDDTFRPEQNISRAEAVSVINRMLARIADQSAINDGAGERYPDVSKNHWAFYEITEASSAHDYTRPSDTAEEEWDV